MRVWEEERNNKEVEETMTERSKGNEWEKGQGGKE